MNVAGRVAIVTGGGGGIGGAIADELAAHGALVVVADLEAASAQAVTDRINAASPGAAVAAGADVTDAAAIRGLIELAERYFGPVDLYFANAGVVRDEIALLSVLGSADCGPRRRVEDG